MSWNNSVITNAGAALLSEAVNGKTITITRAGAGTGTVKTAELVNQTALSDPADVPIAIKKTDEVPSANGQKITISVTNAGLSADVTIRQFGVFAKTDGAEVLMAIIQDAVGETIPSEAGYPDFLLETVILLAISHAASINVVIDKNQYVTRGDLEEFIGSEKGAANGLASLDENGIIPPSQLPNSFVTITKAEFEALVEAGEDDHEVYYVITDIDEGNLDEGGMAALSGSGDDTTFMAKVVE